MPRKLLNPANNRAFKVNNPILENFLMNTTQKKQKPLAPYFRLVYIESALAKSEASRGKLNLSMANTSTPKKNVLFFFRSVYAPIKYSLSFDKLFPMVVRNGQRLIVGCFPLIAVFHPVTCYRPIVENQAVVPQNSSMELSEMKSYIFKFLSLTTGKTISCIIAPSEAHARKKLAENDRLTTQKPLAPCFKLVYIASTVAKSTAGRENPFLLHMANDNTPQACFFIRSTNTSKASYKRLDLSMMAFCGQGIALDCFPYVAVFSPRKTLSPHTVRSVSDSPINLHMELSAMIYLFKAIARRDMGNTRKPISALPVYTLRKQAESEEKARAFFAPYYVILGGGHA